MCEPETDTARDLSRRLMRLCDENVGYLRGAVAAADAICDLLFDQAEQNGAVYSTNRGLRWALEEATAAVEELSKDLHAAHELALVAAGGVTPEARLAELEAERAPEPAT
jgi:hypothetical protein